MNNNFLIRLFKKWIRLKVELHIKEYKEKIIFHEGEVWWASVGQNIGSEQNGKNEKFERPVIILKKFNDEMLLIAPISSKIKIQKYRYQIMLNGRPCAVNLSQIRTISSRRMRKIETTIKMTDLFIIRKILKSML